MVCLGELGMAIAIASSPLRSPVVACQSLVEIFATLPDPRHRRGRIHPLPAILSLGVVAILSGMKSLEAIAQFGRDHGKTLAFALGFRRGKTPAKSTFSLVFRLMDTERFETALGQWAAEHSDTHATHDADDSGIALEGKSLKGSRQGEVPGIHLLAAFATANAAVLGQIRVDAKTNEHKAALQLLGVLPLRGKIVSGDAMFTHRDVAQEVRDGGGDFLLVVKDNQPELKAQIGSALHGDADFSPRPTQAEGSSGATGANGRQRAWPTETSVRAVEAWLRLRG